MFPKARARLERRLVALILAITVAPLAVLLWLGWRLLEQDRLLEQQQVQQRVERGADLVVATLQRALAESERQLAAGGGTWREGAVAVTFHDGSVDVSPRQRVAFVPVAPELPEAPVAPFARGEDLEFRQGALAAASTVYRDLSRSTDPGIRAGALLRLGRTLRNEGRYDESLSAYGRLVEIDGVVANGVPTSLIARYARCKLLDEQHRGSELKADARELDRLLRAGRWALTSPVYSLYAADAARWNGTVATTTASEILADGVNVLWNRWLSTRSSRLVSSGRETIDARGQPLTIVWQASADSFSALVASSTFVESEWLSTAKSIAEEQHVAFALRSAGKNIFGADRLGEPSAVRSASESALPWSVAAATGSPVPEHGDFLLRRRLLITGFVILVSMALVASYLIVRAVDRELAVVRLKSDFVAAVSHEFRTPLTALRQFTDMLRDNQGLDEDRKRVAYEAQSRATDRLTRLVESLLDFGRMEAGARSYHFERRDCGDLLRRVVDDFRAEANATGHAIALHTDVSALIEVDDEAFARAVRNLLDNAVKYSPVPAPIEVGINRQNGHVLISVRDQGLGIAPDEQARIFSKFHRGDQARIRGIKGTGIGLAMVHEIVRAHHGRVDVDSQPGKGSTFTIALPAQPQTLNRET